MGYWITQKKYGDNNWVLVQIENDGENNWLLEYKGKSRRNQQGTAINRKKMERKKWDTGIHRKR